MSGLPLRSVVRLVRGWTWLYTTGTTPVLRDRRRAEIESDLWESCRQPSQTGAATQILFRLLLGVYDDLAWWSSCRRSSTFARVILVAAVGLLMLGSALLFTIGRAAVLPAPPPLMHRARVLAPPPPPPPPPCVPLSVERKSPSPCVR